MSLQIRPADIDIDRARLMSLFRQNLAPEFDDRRFNWLYRNAPAGPARALVASEGIEGAIVGAAAVFPRQMYCDGEMKLGCVLGDFCVDQNYRSLGPAVLLQRACLEEAGRFEFFYDFPSPTMMAVYKRLRIDQTALLTRWAKPLRIERKVTALTKTKALAKGIGVIANPILARRGRKSGKQTCMLALHQGECGEEFRALDSQLSYQPGLRTVRSPAYLNWRYLQHPQVRYEILVARRSDVLIGYGVFAQDSEDGIIADLCSVEEPGIISQLLAGVVELLRQRGAYTVSLNAGDAHPWNFLFERAGFRRREHSPAVFCPSHKSGMSKAPLWYLMQGERDS
jgi:GNAT superfamily N-acetyltransferase